MKIYSLIRVEREAQTRFTEKARRAVKMSFVPALFLLSLIAVSWFNLSTLLTGVSLESSSTFNVSKSFKPAELPVDRGNKNHTCQTSYPTRHKPGISYGRSSCPSYFRWIHEDLLPWKDVGITRNMVEHAKRIAYFRLVIVHGQAYMENYRSEIGNREKSTLWGILQLMRLYPGAVPDLELMFKCCDRPKVPAQQFQGSRAINKPPLFTYCTNESSLDIVFPDWAFWGWYDEGTGAQRRKLLNWAETNIRPWSEVLKDLKKANRRTKWEDRVPYAYWKGAPRFFENRLNLLTCNGTEKNDWNSHLYIQDWSIHGLKHSRIEDQCSHRYKIYIDGSAWSISKRFIMACDSTTLFVRSPYYDFFDRSLLPLQHYWPITEDNKCASLKYAVDWGNNHSKQAKAMGEAASKFIQEELKMEFVYDYMLHLLSEYAKLLRFKPRVPRGAVELRWEAMARQSYGKEKKFMLDSAIRSPNRRVPCAIPAPFDAQELRALLERKATANKQVEVWENDYWRGVNISDKLGGGSPNLAF